MTGFTKLGAMKDLNVIGLVKKEERYIVLYHDDQSSEALRTIGRWASNPGLSFDWWDAARMSYRVLEIRSQVHNRITGGLTP